MTLRNIAMYVSERIVKLSVFSPPVTTLINGRYSLEICVVLSQHATDKLQAGLGFLFPRKIGVIFGTLKGFFLMS